MGDISSIEVTRPRPSHDGLFRSFLAAGFECSTQRLRDGRRLDVVAATGHDVACRRDYERLATFGIRTCREGLRWHLIEARPGRYDFSSVAPMLAAAREMGVQIIWDIFHFGWPDGLDIFSPAFVRRLAGLGAAFARHLAEQGFAAPIFVPVNEPSFVSWGGGDVACLNPFHTGRGFELKVQLVRAGLETIAAIRAVNPHARFMAVDPIIHITHHEDRPEDERACRDYTASMYQAWDLYAGKLWPIIGGEPGMLDFIGVNFYPRNQWTHHPHRILTPEDPRHRPLREMLVEIHDRYRRPLYLSETGTEGVERGPWLRYIAREVEAVLKMGIPLHGLCLYPIVNHPGWEDDRHCRNGLWDYLDDQDERPVEEDLARDLRVIGPRLEALYRQCLRESRPPGVEVASG